MKRYTLNRHEAGNNAEREALGLISEINWYRGRNLNPFRLDYLAGLPHEFDAYILVDEEENEEEEFQEVKDLIRHLEEVLDEVKEMNL